MSRLANEVYHYLLVELGSWDYFELKRLRLVSTLWRDIIQESKKLDGVLFREKVSATVVEGNRTMHPVLAGRVNLRATAAGDCTSWTWLSRATNDSFTTWRIIDYDTVTQEQAVSPPATSITITAKKKKTIEDPHGVTVLQVIEAFVALLDKPLPEEVKQRLARDRGQGARWPEKYVDHPPEDAFFTVFEVRALDMGTGALTIRPTYSD